MWQGDREISKVLQNIRNSMCFYSGLEIKTRSAEKQFENNLSYYPI